MLKSVVDGSSGVGESDMFKWAAGLLLACLILCISIAWRGARAAHTCIICDSQLLQDHSSKTSSACGHNNHACRQCWQHWLDIEVNSKTPDQVGCVECAAILDSESIRLLATDAIYNL